ncbi:MAG: HPr kinase/phosphatase C-terminal domain-containing protein [Beijerinckiaceae bacterium]|jgi:HPr kinase/phosphorylase|nr:HPr kinase/phosphatase C-terminal domain-containing protein [Beijerinckiaceae bacterium]
MAVDVPVQRETAHNIHASAVVLGEAGVLIRGAPGAGKSALASQLICDAPAKGLFSQLVGDDRIILKAAGGRLIARPHPSLSGLIEQRWEAIVRVPHQPSAVLHCVVDLVALAPQQLERLPEAAQDRFVWRDISLPRLVLPAALGSAAQARRVLGFIGRLNRAEFTGLSHFALANS